MVAVSVMREADESAGQNRKSNHGVILPEYPCPDCGFRRFDEFIRPGVSARGGADPQLGRLGEEASVVCEHTERPAA